MANLSQWVSGARPRTLPAAVVPVMLGAAAADPRRFDVATLVINGSLALTVSLALQVGVNYANDYSDGVRGTDKKRSGPRRMVGSGLVQPAAVKHAALLSFLVAAVAGLVLAMATSWWLIVVGLLSIAAAWTYTGGPKPYGYAGWGELFVFVFFGLVATVGTTYVLTQQITQSAILAGSTAGFLAVALLIVNNLRDLDTDSVCRKMTLAVRLGAERTRRLYIGCYVATAVCIMLSMRLEIGAALGLVGLLAALPAVTTVRTAQTPVELISALGMTARVQLVVGALYSVGLVIQS